MKCLSGGASGTHRDLVQRFNDNYNEHVQYSKYIINKKQEIRYTTHAH